jgi:hypothetical protein
LKQIRGKAERFGSAEPKSLLLFDEVPPSRSQRRRNEELTSLATPSLNLSKLLFSGDFLVLFSKKRTGKELVLILSILAQKGNV